MTSNLDTQKLIDELTDIKIKIGIEQDSMEKKMEKLKKMGIEKPEQAKERLEKIDGRLEKLQRKSDRLKKQAIEIIDSVK